jgi:hypothetical protein
MSTEDLKKQLKAFERLLDDALAALPSQQWASSTCLRTAAEIYEITASRREDPSSVEYLDRGYTVLASHFVAGRPGYRPDMSSQADVMQLHEDLVFAAHYYMIRDYLYYSYNVPDSMMWSFKEGRIEITFGDKTIPRQFFTVHNDHILNSLYHFRDFHLSADIERLLENEPEGVVTPNLEAAEPLIQAEADLKLSAYFSLIAPDSQIDLGGYSYEQFLRVYRLLLQKALYHRYLAQVQGVVGAIYIPEEELLEGIDFDLGISPKITRLVLEDLVFDRTSPADRLDAAYFSLAREGEPGGRIVMRPHHFSISEGLVNALRVIAQRRPQTFLDQLSNQIGKAFVSRVRAAWEAQGFICRSEVTLRDVDPTLPDIDLLVISCEPTLGYVIYVCELKCPLPPRWAKDQLKVLNKDSVSKAFRQVAALQKFLRTEAGLAFLASMLPKEGHPNFTSFVTSLNHLVITSDNSGMFFGKEPTKIINFRTLERLLRRSDGDIAFIQHMLHTYDDVADQTVVTKMVEFQLGPFMVAYEGVTKSPLLDFPQTSWRNSDDQHVIVTDFIERGAHPFDVFELRSPDAVVMRLNKDDEASENLVP